MAAAHDRQEGGGLLAAPLFAPVHDGGRVTELARRAGFFAHAGTHPACPAPCLGSDLNKSGVTHCDQGRIQMSLGKLNPCGANVKMCSVAGSLSISPSSRNRIEQLGIWTVIPRVI